MTAPCPHRCAVSWIASPAAAAGGAVRGGDPGQQPGAGSGGLPGAPRAARSISGFVSVAIAGVVWLALLGPVIALLAHVSAGAIGSALSAPGAVTLAVLLLLGTPLAWLLARGALPFPRVWEAGVLTVLLLPPLVIGLLLVFMIG